MNENRIEETIFDRIGGENKIHDLVAEFYSTIFKDPVLQPVFGQPVETHVDHLTAFLSEVFGGPSRYTDEMGGFQQIISVHRRRKITENQRLRFYELFMEIIDNSGLGKDAQLRNAISSCIDFGTQIAQVNSNAKTDAELHPQREMPFWHW